MAEEMVGKGNRKGRNRKSDPTTGERYCKSMLFRQVMAVCKKIQAVNSLKTVARQGKSANGHPVGA